jgi:hypothetical protein
MSRYGNLGSFDYRVTNVPQYDLEADINRGIDRGLKIGQMVAKGVKSDADIRIARQKEIANQAALDKIDKTTREGLILKADDDAGALNDTRIDFSNMLVDRLNQAKIARDNGTLTAADYSKVVMTLEAQIPAYQSGEKVLAGLMGQYMDSVEKENQSGANDPKTIEFLSAMSTGRADVNWTFDENNKMQLTGTWTDSEGNKQPIEAALSKFEQLPHVLTAPEHTAFEQRQADIANVMETKQGAAMSKITSKTDPVTGVPMYESTIDPLTVEVDGKQVLKPWFKQSAEDSFNGYFDSLGEGDLRMGLKSYLLDSTQSGFGYKEVSEMIDGKKDKNGNIIEPTNIDTLKFLKEQIKEDYTQNMLEETLAANKLKVAELQQKNTGDLANVAKDESSIMIATERKRKLTEEAASGKNSGKASGSGDELLDELQRQFNIASTPEKATGLGRAQFIGGQGFDYKKMSRPGEIDFEDIEIPTGPIGSSGEQKKIPDPDNVMIKIGSNKALKVAKDDLNTPEGFMRSYLAAKGIPTKPTKTNPKTIEWYMRRLNLTPVKNISDKYGI